MAVHAEGYGKVKAVFQILKFAICCLNKRVFNDECFDRRFAVILVYGHNFIF